MCAQRFPDADITAIDNNPDACVESDDNFRSSPWRSRLHVACADINDWVASHPSMVDMIICNPPYFSETLRSPDASRADARHIGSLSAATIISIAGRILSPDGTLAIVIPFDHLDQLPLPATLASLFISRVAHISAREGKAPSLALVQLSRKTVAPIPELIHIRDASGYFAKLHIYAFISSAFFPDYSWLVMIGLYFFGIIIGIIVALLMKKSKFKGKAVPFVMELPNYRMPGIKNVAQLLWEKSKDFLQKAFTVIFIATIIIWFLQTFDIHLRMVNDSKDSMLASIAGFISPVFLPLGFGDWRISTSLIAGFMAKESVVSTMTILFGTTEAILAVITPISALALLIFCLLYTPCVAAIAAVKRELGVKWAIYVSLGQCIIAWICAFTVRLICLLITSII